MAMHDFREISGFVTIVLCSSFAPGLSWGQEHQFKERVALDENRNTTGNNDR
jgi:hypothetical protein